MPEAALLLFVLHFQVRNGGVQCRIPVDQALATIDQLLFVQAHKHFLYRLVEAVVHGEAFARPVDASAHAAQLAGNMAAGLVFPLPHFVDKRIATKVVSGLALFSRNLALHQHLRRDTGVVGAYLPQGVIALHPFPARQGIHNGVLERMAHVQAAGHIGRWNHDRKRRALAGGGETVVGFPALVPAGFDLFGLVGLFHGELAHGWREMCKNV